MSHSFNWILVLSIHYIPFEVAHSFQNKIHYQLRSSCCIRFLKTLPLNINKTQEKSLNLF